VVVDVDVDVDMDVDGGSITTKRSFSLPGWRVLVVWNSTVVV
jgi:hypothetical protein